MSGPVRERPPEAPRPSGFDGRFDGRLDPRLTRAMVWSLAIHVAIVVFILLYSMFGPEPARFEAPPGGPIVDLATPRGDSPLLKVGPLAKKAGGQKATVAEPEPAKPPPT